MERNIHATSADLASLPAYSDRQRIAVLSCYLLDPNRFSMQEVAERVLNDHGSQAGQRVSLITRSYGFTARNAGRYYGLADEEDIRAFVSRYHPERCGGLEEGTFDAFLRPRQEERRRRRQQEEAAAQARRQEEARRQAEQRRRQQELAEMERRRQQEQQRQLAEQQRQQAEWQRQQSQRRQQVDQLTAQAAQYWDQPGASLQDLNAGIQLFRKAKTISWEEYTGDGFRSTKTIGNTEEYLRACARAADSAFRAGDHARALEFCQYLCDEYPIANDSREEREILYRSYLLNNPLRTTIGIGYEIRARIYLRSERVYPDLGFQAALMGDLCGVPFCQLCYAECLENGVGTKKDLAAAYQAYNQLKNVPQYAEHAQKKCVQIDRQLLQEAAAEVSACLSKAAPNAFPMVGYDRLDWAAYQQTVLDLPALWETYQREHSTIQETGLIFKKKQYIYNGRISEKQFQMCCQEIWKQRRQQYDLAGYQPCPSEVDQIDALFQQGMEKFQAQAYVDAASALKLPAARGYWQAQKTLVEIYRDHLSAPEQLTRSLDLLAASNRPETYETLARGYAAQCRWEDALQWTNAAEQTPENKAWKAEIFAQAEAWADRTLQDAPSQALPQILRIYQALDDRRSSCGHVLWQMGNAETDMAQRADYWKRAATEYDCGEAYYSLARLEISRQGDRNTIISLLEEAERLHALPEPGELAKQYVSGPEEVCDYPRAIAFYSDHSGEIVDVKTCLAISAKALRQLPPNLKEQTEEQHRVTFQIFQLFLRFGDLSQQTIAQYYLARLYWYGWGTERDPQAANRFLKCSANGGNVRACMQLAKAAQKTDAYDDALSWLQKRSKDTPEALQLQAEIQQAKARKEEESTLDHTHMSQPQDPTPTPQPEPPQPQPELSQPQPPQDAHQTPSSVSQTQDTPAPAEGGRKSAQKVVSIHVLGEEHPVKTASEAMRRTVELLLNKYYPLDVDKCLQATSFLTQDPDKNSSVFRSKAVIETDAAGPIWLGLSTGFDVKCTMMDKLCHVLQVPAGAVSWDGPDGPVYQTMWRRKYERTDLRRHRSARQMGIR